MENAPGTTWVKCAPLMSREDLTHAGTWCRRVHGGDPDPGPCGAPPVFPLGSWDETG